MNGCDLSITYSDTVTVDDYENLRESAGWNRVHPDQALASLRGSAFLIAARDGSRTVGTARVVWDGGCAALVKDVLVLPEYRLRGIGREMMNRALRFLKSKLKPGYFIEVDLMAADGKEPFYMKLGFDPRPRPGRGSGMEMLLKAEEGMET